MVKLKPTLADFKAYIREKEGSKTGLETLKKLDKVLTKAVKSKKKTIKKKVATIKKKVTKKRKEKSTPKGIFFQFGNTKLL